MAETNPRDKPLKRGKDLFWLLVFRGFNPRMAGITALGLRQGRTPGWQGLCGGVNSRDEQRGQELRYFLVAFLELAPPHQLAPPPPPARD